LKLLLLGSLGILWCTWSIVVPGCTRVAPRNVEYEPGRWSFDWPGSRDLEPEVQSSMGERFARDADLLTAKFQDEMILQAIRDANEREATAYDILKRDEKWTEEGGIDPLVANLLAEDCSQSLQLFRKTFPQFAEVFVTNARGENVCLSNKTTDYYQADEEWWKRTFATARASHGRLEYDESAKVLAVSIYVPVLDPKTGSVIGVGKGVVRREVATKQKPKGL
jgi:hypothetical protein